MSKKIIIIRNAYAHDFGGGERFPVFLANVLSKLNYEPFIVSRNPQLLELTKSNQIPMIKGWWWSKQRWNGWRVLLFPIYALWQLLLFFWYHHIFKKYRPQAVHIQSKDDFIAATYAAKRLNIRIIWTDHADLKHIFKNLTAPFKNPIGKWVYRAAHLANAITLVSKSELSEVANHLPEESLIRDKLTVVYNGCGDVLSHYSYMPNPDLFTFVLASRLVTDKGISEAIDAFKQFHTRHNNSRLLIAGDGPERERFIQQANDISTIEFLGHQADPYKIITQADVFLQPTYHEGFSVVLVEASMLQKAIIATAVGGNVEIVHDHVTGLLVPPKDPVILDQAMEELYQDKDLRGSVAMEARAQYEKSFVFDKIVEERFVELYNEITN